MTTYIKSPIPDRSRGVYEGTRLEFMVTLCSPNCSKEIARYANWGLIDVTTPKSVLVPYNHSVLCHTIQRHTRAYLEKLQNPSQKTLSGQGVPQTLFFKQNMFQALVTSLTGGLSSADKIYGYQSRHPPRTINITKPFVSMVQWCSVVECFF